MRHTSVKPTHVSGQGHSDHANQKRRDSVRGGVLQPVRGLAATTGRAPPAKSTGDQAKDQSNDQSIVPSIRKKTKHIGVIPAQRICAPFSRAAAGFEAFRTLLYCPQRSGLQVV